MSSGAARVVVLAPNWLGDAVMALPALQSVRAAFPAAHLAVAARPSVAALYAMVPGVDAVLSLESRGGVSNVKRWRRDAARLAAERFDLAVLLPNAFIAAWITAQARIPERWGFDTDLRGRWLTKSLRRPAPALHQADYYLALTTAAGLPPAPRVARLVVPEAARAAAARLVPARDYVVLAPGAAYGRAKQWPPDRFAALACTMWQTRGVIAVLVGAGGDAAAGVEFTGALPGLPGGAGTAAALVDLIGKTDLATLAGVLSQARAVVANDSGAMHLAGAVGAPVVAIFGPTNEQQTAPLSAALDAPPPRLAIHHVWCRPCMLRECPLGHMCMRGVASSDVAALIP
ncbi:MAG TPA: lipopolysaccharide heptosyltransferase II [Vicinamibacterales bacterium]|nr:lipopolysaccharide heptosyltransferase II [Vicinamibacterales bacterium]